MRQHESAYQLLKEGARWYHTFQTFNDSKIMLRLQLKILEDSLLILAKIDAEEIGRAHLNIPSNGSINGSHASKCLLNVDAAIEQINTAFIVSNLP